MAGENITLTELIRHGVTGEVDRIHVALPGKVTTYDPITNTVVVKPMVKRALYNVDDAEREYEELPEIPFVPVIWPRAGGFVLRMPIASGDSVLLVFNDFSLAEWRQNGELAEPEDARTHTIGWPIAIPGLFPDVSPLSASDAPEVTAGGMILGQDGGSAQLLIGGTFSGIRFGKTAVSPIALATPTDAALTAIVSALNALITAFNSHVHTGVTTGAGSSGTTISTVSAASAPSTTASALVKSA